MSDPLALRALSEAEAAALPDLLARAEHLAGAVLLGAHGRRRAGAGDDFWQYRPAQVGDSRRAIDYRRSAMGDTEFVREREWQIAQSVMMWVDQGASMRFASSDALPSPSALPAAQFRPSVSSRRQRPMWWDAATTPGRMPSVLQAWITK